MIDVFNYILQRKRSMVYRRYGCFAVLTIRHIFPPNSITVVHPRFFFILFITLKWLISYFNIVIELLYSNEKFGCKCDNANKTLWYSNLALLSILNM